LSGRSSRSSSAALALSPALLCLRGKSQCERDARRKCECS
jgi:hypothetical protein